MRKKVISYLITPIILVLILSSIIAYINGNTRYIDGSDEESKLENKFRADRYAIRQTIRDSRREARMNMYNSRDGIDDSRREVRMNMYNSMDRFDESRLEVRMNKYADRQSLYDSRWETYMNSYNTRDGFNDSRIESQISSNFGISQKIASPSRFVKVTSYTTHAPIYIDSNAIFSSLGFPGSGTESNPYLITGYNITSSVNTLIEIRNTDVYFQISDCLLNGVMVDYYKGIYLYNVQNGIISNNMIQFSSWGIELRSSSNIILTGNTIHDCTHFGIFVGNSNNIIMNGNTCFDIDVEGIYLSYCSSCILISNTCYNNDRRGILLTESSDCALIDNTCYSNIDGILTARSNNLTISENTCYGNTNSGIKLGLDVVGQIGSNDCTIINNTCYSNGDGITTRNSVSNNLTDNSIYGNYNGIKLYDSSNNILTNNTCNDNTYSISLLGASNYNILKNNTCYNNVQYGYGIWVAQSGAGVPINNTLDSNTCYNKEAGIVIWYSDNNILIGNNVYNNYRGFWIYDSNNNILKGDNTCYSNNYGINVEHKSSYNTVTNTSINSNAYHGILLMGDTSFNVIERNYFIDNNPQAFDAGSNNIFRYNYWNEWISPDDDENGIVDDPYFIDGEASGKDQGDLDGTWNHPYSQDIWFPTAQSFIPSKNTISQVELAMFKEEIVSVVNGTYTFDLETGTEGTRGSDFWWEQVSAGIEMYLVPIYGAEVANLGTSTDYYSIDYDFALSLSYSTTPINGSIADNQIPAGTVLVWHTGEDNYAKMQIVTHGYDLFFIYEILDSSNPFFIFLWLANASYPEENTLAQGAPYPDENSRVDFTYISTSILPYGHDNLEWILLDFDSPIPVIPGDVYWIVVSTNSSYPIIRWTGSEDNPYPDGHRAVPPGSSLDRDMLFRTYFSGQNTDPYPLTYPDHYSPGTPIYIDDNSDFTGYGFPGSGTEGDPYLIEDYSITGSTANLIHIQDTNVHFIIRNCSLDSIDNSFRGIYLYNVENGIIDNNTIQNCLDGIYLEYSSNNTLIGNTVSNNDQIGICVYYSNYNNLSMNTVHSNINHGIFLYSSDNNNLTGNDCYDNTGAGIYLLDSDDNELTDNDCYDNTGSGIDLESSNDNTQYRL
ncbi:MAG: NosD domain-containing protein [Candidatus Hodarchaeales archaeon]